MSFLFLVITQPARCEKFHIVLSEDCPGKLTGEPCFRLHQYMSGEYRKYTSDPSEIVLEFQPGQHYLPISGHNLDTLASNLVSFTMKSINSTEINCHYQRSILFYQINHVQNVYINGIHFRQCNIRIESVMNFTLEKSNFSQARHYHDALYIRDSSATIKGCNFTSNNRIPLHVDNTLISIDFSSFLSNRGSITIENGHHKNVTISNSHFSSNTRASYYSSYSFDAGALSVFTSYLELHNTTFISNQGRNGGALAVQNTQSSVNITQCNFIGNTAEYGGGAIIIVYSSSSIITVQHSTFSRNRIGGGQSSRVHGGAIHVYKNGYGSSTSTSISIQQSMFMNNQVGNGNGGAIYASGSNINFHYPLTRVNS